MSSGRTALSAAAAALLAAVAPALAAQDHTITASSDVFTPASITIATGDRVVFANSGGSHNFVFEDGPRFPQTPRPAGDAVWSTPLSRVFTVAGTYRFYCATHGGPGGVGMSGTVTVAAGGPVPAPTPTPTPTATPTPGATGQPPAPQGGGALQVRSLTTAAKSFCVRRGPGCRRPGVRLRIDLSAPARVTGVLRRRPPRAGAPGRRFGRVDFGTVAAGPRTLTFQRTASGKRLTAGRYTLAATVRGAGSRSLSFRVR
jgi:plastocyanin